jgi:hypothetical protein
MERKISKRTAAAIKAQRIAAASRNIDEMTREEIVEYLVRICPAFVAFIGTCQRNGKIEGFTRMKGGNFGVNLQMMNSVDQTLLQVMENQSIEE